MVQQKTEDFPIIDETPPEQVAIEEKVMAGEPVQPPAAPVEEAPAAEAPPAEAPAPQAPVQAPPEKPAARTFTEDQVRQMQSRWDKQIADERKRAAEASRRLQEFDLNAGVEAHLRQQERQLEPGIGAEEARKVIRTPENERQVREALGAQQKARVLEEQVRSMEAEQEFSARVVTARLFTQQYGVPAEDVEVLLAAPTPAHMERLAQRLGSRKAATTEAKQAVRGQVPVETEKTKLESGVVTAASPESFERMVERLNVTPSWEWSARDREFMRTGRVQ